MKIGNSLLKYLLTLNSKLTLELPDSLKINLIDLGDNLMLPIFETDGNQVWFKEVDISDDWGSYPLPFDNSYITEEILNKILGRLSYVKIYLFPSARVAESDFWITKIDKNKILKYNSEWDNQEFYGIGSMYVERFGDSYRMTYYSRCNDVSTALTNLERIYCIDLPTKEDLLEYGKFLDEINTKKKI